MSDGAVSVAFNIPTLCEHLNSDDPLAMVVRAHLYVESALIRLIEAVIVRKDVLDVSQLPFPLKVSLAVALGLIDPDSRGSLSALNRLRVRFAHNLSTKLTEQDELDLYNSLSKMQRGTVDDMQEPGLPYIGRLRLDFAAIIANVELATHMALAQHFRFALSLMSNSSQ